MSTLFITPYCTVHVDTSLLNLSTVLNNVRDVWGMEGFLCVLCWEEVGLLSKLEGLLTKRMFLANWCELGSF